MKVTVVLCGGRFVFFTCMSDSRKNELGFSALQPLLTPVGHRLDRQEVGSSRQQALKPQLTLRL